MWDPASRRSPDFRAVFDTNIFVPAIAGEEAEASLYNTAIRVCWKFLFSPELLEEYRRVINEYGYRADVVMHELNKLHAMNKCRCCAINPDEIGENLAPRKDRHVIATCKAGHADAVVTHDRGIHERKADITTEIGTQVFSLSEAQDALVAYAERQAAGH